MKYKYFIAYTWTSANASGFGNCELTRDKEITEFADIMTISKLLVDDSKNVKEGPWISIAILNYTKFP